MLFIRKYFWFKSSIFDNNDIDDIQKLKENIYFMNKNNIVCKLREIILLSNSIENNDNINEDEKKNKNIMNINYNRAFGFNNNDNDKKKYLFWNKTMKELVFKLKDYIK